MTIGSTYIYIYLFIDFIGIEYGIILDSTILSRGELFQDWFGYLWIH